MFSKCRLANIETDAKYNSRPHSVTATSKAVDGVRENGASKGELDEKSKHKAETKYPKFFEIDTDPVADATGPADFN